MQLSPLIFYLHSFLTFLNICILRPRTCWPGTRPRSGSVSRHSQLYNGNFAVSIFFVLTGFVLTAKFYETGDVNILKEGAIKRYPRLVLPAFASVLFVLVILYAGQFRNHLAIELNTAGWVLEFYKEPVDLLRAIYVGLIGAPVFGDTLLNAPLWTLRYELVGSFLIFGFYSLFGKQHKLLLFFCFLLIAFALGAPPYYLSFVLGSFIHLFTKWLKRRQIVSGIVLFLGMAFGFWAWRSGPAIIPRSTSF